MVKREHILSWGQEGSSVIVVNRRIGALRLLANIHCNLGIMIRIADKFHHVVAIRMSILTHLRDLCVGTDEPWMIKRILDLDSLVLVLVQKF
jgi:hypothetical protein